MIEGHDYRTLHTLVRHKHWLPQAMAAVCVAAGAWGVLRTGYLDFLFAGLAMAAICYVAVKALLEMMHMVLHRSAT